MAATPAATPGQSSRLRHIPLYERILARPAAGAAIIVVFVWVVFALLGGSTGFLTAEGTLSYLDVAAQLEAGQVYVNEWVTGTIETPFGGYKQSGYGREKGLEALQHYTQTKCQLVSYDPNPLGFL